jgi:hypothetical protein
MNAPVTSSKGRETGFPSIPAMRIPINGRTTRMMGCIKGRPWIYLFGSASGALLRPKRIIDRRAADMAESDYLADMHRGIANFVAWITGFLGWQDVRNGPAGIAPNATASVLACYLNQQRIESALIRIRKAR